MSNQIAQGADIFKGDTNEIIGLDRKKQEHVTHTAHNNKFENNAICDSIRGCLGELIGFGFSMMNVFLKDINSHFLYDLYERQIK